MTTPNRSVQQTTQANLNSTQQRIHHLVKRDLASRQLYRNGVTTRYKPLGLLVHGGPGTGKSYLTHCIVSFVEEMGFTVKCMAPTGILTSSLHKATTIHNGLGINQRTKSNVFYSLLQGEQLFRYRSRLKWLMIAYIILDEMSYIGPQMLAQIERRLRNIMGVDEPFGGLSMVLLGDSFQLPPVNPGETTMSAVIR